jgi:hypothetical protein
LWRAQPDRSAPASKPGQAPGVYLVGPSFDLELIGLLIGWCAVAAAVERLVLHRGSTFSALTLSAALAGGPVAVVAIIGTLTGLSDPGVSTGRGGDGIAVFFFGLLLVGCGALIDLLAPAALGTLSAPGN